MRSYESIGIIFFHTQCSEPCHIIIIANQYCQGIYTMHDHATKSMFLNLCFMIHINHRYQIVL